LQRIGQVLEHFPHGDYVERGLLEFLFQEIAGVDSETAVNRVSPSVL